MSPQPKLGAITVCFKSVICFLIHGPNWPELKFCAILCNFIWIHQPYLPKVIVFARIRIMLELNHASPKISKDDYKTAVESLRTELLSLQHRVRQHDKPVIIVIAGDDRSGRHESINTLCKWMDPRYLSINAYGPSQHEDDSRPFFWRFWRDLPAAGELAIYLRDWTSTSIVQYLNHEIDEAKLRKRELYIRNFERKQTDAGALMIKCWLHIDEDVLAERVAEIRDTPYFDIKDELALKNYDSAIHTIQATLNATSTDTNPWHVIDGSDEQRRNLEIGTLIKCKIEEWLQSDAKQQSASVDFSQHPTKDIPLTPADKPATSDKKDNKKTIKKLQSKLRESMFELRKNNIPVVLVFEGCDAAGKGGAIRRIVAPLDAGFYKIHPIAKPSEDEYAHHYLWRFWNKVPRNGFMSIFDRSWYGRVLVERVEGFAAEHEWQRAYKEINDFEEQLAIHDTLVMKFWLSISKEEQIRRFEERQNTPHKHFKITEEDFRNRERWDDYLEAATEMIQRTDTEAAPWTLVCTNDKDEARIAILTALTKAFKQKIKSESSEP